MDRSELTQPMLSIQPLTAISSDNVRCKTIQRIAKAFQVAYDESNLDLTEDSCFSAIAEACKRREESKIRGHADDIAKITNLYRQTVLMHLVTNQNWNDAAKLLIKERIALLTKDPDGNTALHFAAMHGNIWSVQLLTKRVPQTKNNFGETPLHLAIFGAHQSVVDHLLKSGAKSKEYLQIDLSGARSGLSYVELNALGLAVMLQHKRCVEVILKQDPSLIAIDCGRHIGSVLHVAIQFRKMDMLRNLLEKYIYKQSGTSRLNPGESENLFRKQDAKGRSPLSLAAYLGNLDAIMVLKNAGADLEVGDLLGCPLHYAVLGLQADAIERLLSLGVNNKSEDRNGKRPIDLLPVSEDDDKIVYCRTILENQTLITSFREPIEYLVFEGGGPKGLAYAGAVMVLDESGKMDGIQAVAGTSAGAITALLVALGYTGREIRDFMMSQDILEFLESTALKQIVQGNGILKTAYQAIKGAVNLARPDQALSAIFNMRMLMEFKGLCTGEKALEWIEGLIYQKTGIPHLTMGELRELVYRGKAKHLHVFGTLLGPIPKIAHFSSTDQKCNNYIVSDLVSLSTRIPLVYEPHTVHVKENGRRLSRPEHGFFVDGGLLRNFPVNVFDSSGQPNKRTLGFCLYSSTSAPPPLESKQIQGQELVASLLKIYFEAEALIRDANGADNNQQSIRIDVKEVNTLSFSLSAHQKQELVFSGQESTLDFLQKRDLASEERVKLPLMAKFRPEISETKEQGCAFPSRQLLLAAIDGHLQKRNFLRRTATCILYGPEGFGKKELAYAFARRFQDEFSIIREISCETNESYKSGYSDLSREDLQNADLDVAAVNRWLSQGAFDKPWLLILSNVSADRELALPERGGVVIITSSANLNADSAFLVGVPPLSNEEALQVFRSKVQPEKYSDAELGVLASSLGYNPRQIGIAADYIQRTGCAVSDYVEPALAQAAALDLLKVEDPVSYDFLSTCAYLHFDRISTSLIKKWQALGNHEGNPSVLVDSLVSRFFASYGEQEGVISLIPGVQKILRDLQTGQGCQEQHYGQAVSLLATWLMPEFPEKNPDQRVWREGSDHANQLLKYPAWEQVDQANCFKILLGLSNWLESVRGDPRAGLAYCQNASKVAAKLGKQELALALSQLGRCLLALGEPKEALANQERAAQLIAELNDPRQVDFLCRIDNQKGNCLLALGLYEEALISYQSGQKLREAAFSLLHRPSSKERKAFENGQAVSYNKIARTLLAFKHPERAREALQAAEKAFKIRQKTSPDSKAVAKSYEKIGKCYLDLGQHQKALIYTKQGLELMEKLRENKQHGPGDATIRNKVARCYFALGRYAEALHYYSEALTYRQWIFGDRHRSTATSLKKVGKCLFMLKQYSQALASQQESLKIQRELFGVDAQNQDVASNLSYIGDCLFALSRTKEAFEAYMLALTVHLALKSGHARLARNVDRILNCLQLHPDEARFEELKVKLEVMLESRSEDAGTLVDEVRRCVRDGYFRRQWTLMRARL